MCGRFTLATELDHLIEIFGLDAAPQAHAPRYNIAPSQPVAAIANGASRVLDFFTWGLVPSWAKDAAIGHRLINARAETAAEKPAFKAAYRRRRCLIPADGFYEWKKTGAKKKTPYFIRLASGEPFGLAGLWENWQGPDGSEILSCTILTTAPNALVGEIHDRMPVILPARHHGRWLDPDEVRPGALSELLAPYPADEMEAWPVSARINSPAYDGPELIERVEPERTLF